MSAAVRTLPRPSPWLVAIIAAPLGLFIGAISGYFGGWVDRVMMGLTDIFLSMPKLILAIQQ